jgi:hypothetical protein
MVLKGNMYPDLAEEFREYLMRKDKEDFLEYVPASAPHRDENLRDNTVMIALENSQHDLKQLSVLSNSRAFQEASKINSELIQRLKDYRLRRLYTNANTPTCEHAIKLLNTLYDPKWMHDFDHFSNDTEKFAHVDELRARTNERGSLNEALSTLEDGMKGADFDHLGHTYKNLMGSTIDEIMYKTNLYPLLNPFWRSYLIFNDRQKYHQILPQMSDQELDRHMIHVAITCGYENRHELVELENSSAWKNYMKKYGYDKELKKTLQCVDAGRGIC